MVSNNNFCTFQEILRLYIHPKGSEELRIICLSKGKTMLNMLKAIKHEFLQ